MPKKTNGAVPFSAEERAAMQELAQERRGGGQGEEAVRAKIQEMTGRDREIAEGLHALVRELAPELQPRTWYGMPAYAREGHVLLFFQPAAKFKSRYATLGFSDKAPLDEGDFWPVTYAIQAWTPETQAQVTQLLVRALA